MDAAALRPSPATLPPPERPADAEALLRRAASDPDAFGVLYRAHYAAIAGYILRRVGDRHLAEDLAAETFLDAWRGLASYQPRGVPFEHWLLRIATNRINRWARRRKLPTETLGEPHNSTAGQELPAPPTPQPASLPTDAIDMPPVHTALQRLRPRHQTVLCLHHVEGLSIEQVAAVLGCAAGTVKSRLHRARRLLRRELAQMEDAP